MSEPSAQPPIARSGAPSIGTLGTAEAVIEFWWSVALASLGVIVPGIAAFYEFVLKGRKRLGYRVQLDTTATEVVATPFRGALGEMRIADVPLADPTLVLLRIENIGSADIGEDDYAVPNGSTAGITVTFPDRKVVGMVVTELSDEYLGSFFKDWTGLTVQGDTIELPRVQLNRRCHYKVLAALDRADEATGPIGHYHDPRVSGGIRGGVGRGGIEETESRTGTPKRAMALIALLAVIVVAQLLVFVQSDRGAPMDCSSGTLEVTGSTAFEPVVREAAASYQDSCPGAVFSLDMRGSHDGLLALDRAGRDGGTGGGDGLAEGGPAAGRLVFSDGEKPPGMPGLVARPIAFFLFTVVVDDDAGVNDLTVDQVRRLYRGQVANWQEVGGADLPVRLISRDERSGTRAAFQRRVLGGKRELGSNSDDCRSRDPGSEPGVVRCVRGSTSAVLAAVADTPGAIGYSELGAATGLDGVVPVRLDGRPATVADADHGRYPFWETEFGYTWGDPPAGSLAASFLRYLTNQVGADVIRAHGDRPCAELANPQLCHPT